ncbi:MAG: GNAT family N-acetyltransferase [Crocinitomicaceae bacterium]|nr:GNAT family N-acetyltransferase [Crocinitomicaceae bacterium]
MISFESIETNRLLLKAVDANKLAEIYATCDEEEAMKLLGFSTREEYLADKAKSDGGFVTYDRKILGFIMVIKEGDIAIGRCGFHNWYHVHKRAELGYAIFKENYRGHGYMREAMPALLDYGFNKMNLNRIEAFIGPTNEPSLRVVKKHGFTEEGRLKQHFVYDDTPLDSLIFALLREEYFQQSGG